MAAQTRVGPWQASAIKLTWCGGVKPFCFVKVVQFVLAACHEASLQGPLPAMVGTWWPSWAAGQRISATGPLAPMRPSQCCRRAGLVFTDIAEFTRTINVKQEESRQQDAEGGGDDGGARSVKREEQRPAEEDNYGLGAEAMETDEPAAKGGQGEREKGLARCRAEAGFQELARRFAWPRVELLWGLPMAESRRRSAYGQ